MRKEEIKNKKNQALVEITLCPPQWAGINNPYIEESETYLILTATEEFNPLEERELTYEKFKDLLEKGILRPIVLLYYDDDFGDGAIYLTDRVIYYYYDEEKKKAIFKKEFKST